MKKVIIILLVIISLFGIIFGIKKLNTKDNHTPEETLESDVIVFKDKNLENAIKNIMGTDDIKINDALNIKSLYLDNLNIKDISGIEYFKNLEALSMSQNNIKDISKLKSLTKLKILLLNLNKIKDISPLKNLTSLEKLSLFSNEIEDVSALTSLNNLTNMPTLYNNNITNLEVMAPHLDKILNNSLNNFYTYEFKDNDIIYKRDFSNQYQSGCNDTYVRCESFTNYEWNKNNIKTYKEAKEVAKNFASTLTSDMIDLDKVIKISEFIVKKMVYKSTDGLYDGTNDLYYPLVLGYGQCHNYAQSFNFLANLVGLVSYSAFAGALHEWNLVKIDGKFYHLDLTWADQGDTLDYRFVNVSTNTIDALHGFKFNYPTDIEISSKDLQVKEGI